MTQNKKVLILLDADVAIHLFKADKISLLSDLYNGRIRMLDIVLSELRNNRTICNIIDNLFTYKQVEEIKFPTTSNPVLLREYLSLKQEIKGDGERASLLYCKHHNHIIASSNTSDISSFCSQNSIAYLTTLDIFAIAIHKKLITHEETNTSIKQILIGSYLLCDTIEEYIEKYFKEEKTMY